MSNENVLTPGAIRSVNVDFQGASQIGPVNVTSSDLSVIQVLTDSEGKNKLKAVGVGTSLITAKVALDDGNKGSSLATASMLVLVGGTPGTSAGEITLS